MKQSPKHLRVSLRLLAAAVLFLATQSAPAAPWEGGLFVNLNPTAEFTSRPSETAAISDRFFGEFFNKPTFASGGTYIKNGPLSAVGILEFQQDIWSKLDKRSVLNIPDDRTIWYPSVIGLGTMYPNVGYAEYDSEALRVSVGRRKLRTGPGTYALGLSDYNPFYDHVAARLAAPVGKGRIAYDYAAVGMQRWSDGVDGSSSSNPKPKYLFFHRASWTGPKFSIGLTELNLLADVTPDFQDWGPFLFYHNFFNNHHNVMVNLDMTWTPSESVAVFGEFVMDDFQIGAEGGNPNAFGFMAGAEYTILPGQARQGAKFLDSDYTYRIGGRAEKPGLTARIEGYLLSTYLYRRNLTVPEEAFTARYHVFSNWSNGSRLVGPFLATPLAPDTALGRISLAWVDNPLVANFSYEYRLKGSESETKTYNVSTLDASAWLWPTNPTPESTFTLDASYRLGALCQASAKAQLVLEQGTSPIVNLGIGFARRFNAGKGPSF